MMNTIPRKIRLVASGMLIIATLTACTPTSTSAPTLTPESSPAQPTEIPLPAWVTEFSDPILFAIQDRSPDFQDDFSKASTSWIFETAPVLDHGNIDIANGALMMSTDPGQSAYASHNRMNFQNFVLQVDVNFQQLDAQKQVNMLWRRDYDGAEVFQLRNDGSWSLLCYYAECPVFASGSESVDLSKPVTIKIVSKGTEFAVYLDNIPLAYHNDIGRPPASDIRLELWVNNDNEGTSAIAYDNLSVWNLDTVFTPPIETPLPTASPTPAPWIADFSAPLLYAIQDRHPDFQDDFSQSDTGWVFITGNGDGTVEIANGVMNMGAVSEQNAIATHKKVTLNNNFVLQVDVNFLELEDRISAGISWCQYGSVGEGFNLYNDGSWTLMRNDRPEYTLFASGSESVDLSKPVTITIVSRGTEFAVYMNNNPLAYHNDIGRPPANGIQLGIFNHADHRINPAVAYDNLRVWNLDSLLPPPIVTPVPTATPHPLVASFGNPILLAIQGRLPDYQDDFSQGSSGWISSPGASVNISNGILALSGGVGQGVDNVLVPRSNFTNFVVQVEVNTQKLIGGCEATIQWRGGADGPGRIFGLQNGRWSLYSIYQSQDDLPFPADMPSNGALPLSDSGVYTITIISKGSEIAVYLNGEPITYVMDIVRPPDPGFHFGLWYPDFCTAEYDNLKVWDLDKLK